MARIDGPSLGLVAAGIVFGYAGFKGYSIPQTVQDIVTGKSPAGQPVAKPITGTAAGVTGASSATGEAIAQDALQYKGAGYVWDGAPANGPGQWDCSSFCNWVIGHDEKLAIPGFAAGTYTGAEHGPSSFIWAAWNGCTTIGHTAAVSQAGDLCIWMSLVGHIGIATGGGQMISAENPTDGTQVSDIDGFDNGLLIIRRLKAAGG
jgi:cell wall-associated NlpC family hydrolase